MLAASACACVGFSACDKGTELDEWKEKGYTVSVTYDANGGEFLKNAHITQIVDVFNPTLYEADINGNVHIPLVEPTSASRPTSGKNITVDYTGHFFAGWYQTRTVVEKNGSPVDENGEALTEQEDGTYVYTSTLNDETPRKGLPAYTYSNYWDFETDTIEVAQNGEKDITLYAGWVQLYEFQYYYMAKDDPATPDNEAGWTQYGKTTFDYKTVNEAGSVTADKDGIFLPDWKDGAMNHEYAYANGDKYTFPSVDGTTFAKAYLDKDCTQQITTATFTHQGTLVKNSGEDKALVVENRVQKIYVELEEGEKYKISTAEELSKNVNLNGLYEILADLTFTDTVKWPAAFTRGEFNGSFVAVGGAKKITGINLKYSNSSAQYGGVFGAIGAGASVKGFTFENVTLDYANAAAQNNSNFGLFAGYIDDDATVENVSITGAMKLGQITCKNGTTTFNLVANGNTAGVTAGEIALTVYGRKLNATQYLYYVVPSSVTVDATTKAISFELDGTLRLETSEYPINL